MLRTGFTLESLWGGRRHQVQSFSPLSVFSSGARCQIREPRGLLWIASLRRQTEGKRRAQYSLDQDTNGDGTAEFAQTKQQQHTHHKVFRAEMEPAFSCWPYNKSGDSQVPPSLVKFNLRLKFPDTNTPSQTKRSLLERPSNNKDLNFCIWVDSCLLRIE